MGNAWDHTPTHRDRERESTARRPAMGCFGLRSGCRWRARPGASHDVGVPTVETETENGRATALGEWTKEA